MNVTVYVIPHPSWTHIQLFIPLSLSHRIGLSKHQRIKAAFVPTSSGTFGNRLASSTANKMVKIAEVEFYEYMYHNQSTYCPCPCLLIQSDSYLESFYIVHSMYINIYRVLNSIQLLVNGVVNGLPMGTKHLWLLHKRHSKLSLLM